MVLNGSTGLPSSKREFSDGLLRLAEVALADAGTGSGRLRGERVDFIIADPFSARPVLERQTLADRIAGSLGTLENCFFLECGSPGLFSISESVRRLNAGECDVACAVAVDPGGNGAVIVLVRREDLGRLGVPAYAVVKEVAHCQADPCDPGNGVLRPTRRASVV